MLGNVDEVLQRILDALNHRDRIRIATLLQNRQVNRRLAVHANDVGLNRLSIDRFADIAYQHRRLTHRLQWHLVDRGCRRILAIGIEVVVEWPDLHVAGREDQVALVDFAHDIHGAQLMRLQLQRVDVNHDLAILPAKGLWHGSAGNIGDLVSNVVLAKVVELRLVKALAFQSDQANGQTGRVKLEHDRRQSPRRKAAEMGHGQIRNSA